MLSWKKGAVLLGFDLGQDSANAGVHRERMTNPDGGDIKTVRDAVHLGGLVSGDGRASPELPRRLGGGEEDIQTIGHNMG